MLVLQIVLFVILGLAILVFILNLIAPRTANVERSVLIDASKEQIFPHLLYFDKREEWSPWAEMAPQMKKRTAR